MDEKPLLCIFTYTFYIKGHLYEYELLTDEAIRGRGEGSGKLQRFPKSKRLTENMNISA